MKRTIMHGNCNIVIEQRDADIGLVVRNLSPGNIMETQGAYMDPGVARQIGRLLIAMADAVSVDTSWQGCHESAPPANRRE